MTDSPKPPIAATRPHSFTTHGITIDDPWAWLKDPSYPDVKDKDVLAYLEAENAYFEAMMAPHKPLTDRLYEEMKGRIKEDDASVPQKDGDWLYWTAFETGGQYRKWWRKPVAGGEDQLILDEPANGLDPAEVRALRERLGELARGGAAVLVSSHQLAEVQQLATHAVVMNQGRLVASGPLDELLGGEDAYRVEVDDTGRAAAVLREARSVESVAVRDGHLVVTAPGTPPARLVEALVAAGVGVMSVNRADRSLEEAFLTMTEGEGERAAR